MAKKPDSPKVDAQRAMRLRRYEAILAQRKAAYLIKQNQAKKG